MMTSYLHGQKFLSTTLLVLNGRREDFGDNLCLPIRVCLENLKDVHVNDDDAHCDTSVVLIR